MYKNVFIAFAVIICRLAFCDWELCNGFDGAIQYRWEEYAADCEGSMLMVLDVTRCHVLERTKGTSNN